MCYKPAWVLLSYSMIGSSFPVTSTARYAAYNNILASMIVPRTLIEMGNQTIHLTAVCVVYVAN